ncbi:MAG: hypothetical protein ACLPKT_25500 [Methylocella sp.]
MTDFDIIQGFLGEAELAELENADETLDATDAAAALERIRVLLKELADDLEAEVEGHYQGIKDHPAMTPKYERDMSNVKKARALLAGSPHGPQDVEPWVTTG